MTVSGCDIAIVGGGMVGLSQALLLARQLPDRHIVLLESFPLQAQPLQPSFDDRATALSAAAAEVFGRLGLWEALAKRAEPIRRVHVSDRGHVGSVAYTEAQNQQQPLGFVVENRHLGQRLGEAVQSAGIEVMAPATVTRIQPRAQATALHIQQGEQSLELLAQLVIVADGVESPLRRQLGICADEHHYQQSAVIANVAFDQPHEGQAFERFTADGPLALLPLPTLSGAASRRAALVWTRPQLRLQETLAWDEPRFIAELQHSFGYRLGNCLQVGARSSYPLKMVFAREQVRRGIVFIGNAAHFLHPVAGQGFNLALRDCTQLSAVLAQADKSGLALGELAILNRYLALQGADQAATAWLSHNFIRVFTSHNPCLQLGRNLGLVTLALWDGARQEFFQQMMGRALPRARLHSFR